MQAVRFTTVGELLVDVLAEGSGHDAHIRLRPAGSAFNAAAAAATAGAEATVVGTVGDDAGGRMLLAELAARGVNAEVTVAGGSTGTFLLAGGEIRVDRGVGHDVVVPDRLVADAVLVSGHLPRATIEEALGRARAQWVALDAARLDLLPEGGNAVIANDEAARRLTGATGEEAARALAEGRRLACVTLGAAGAVAVSGARVEQAAPERVGGDAPGPGDAFAGTLLVALARGHDLAHALSGATRAALDSLA
jgi:sugar/nucleoside kinase (ribokinase family)